MKRCTHISGVLRKTHLVDAVDLPGGGTEHHPLASVGPHHDHLSVRREAGGLSLLTNIIAPDNGPERDRYYSYSTPLLFW